MYEIAGWIGLLILTALGFMGVFRPQKILEPYGISLEKPEAIIEMRAVFGGLLLGPSVVIIFSQEPVAYLAAAGVMLMATLVKLGGTIFQQRTDAIVKAIPGDFAIGVLLLCGYLAG